MPQAQIKIMPTRCDFPAEKLDSPCHLERKAGSAKPSAGAHFRFVRSFENRS